MDGSEISSGQGKGEAQVFGANQALALSQRYNMNRMKYSAKQLSDMSKKSENISYEGTRPGDAEAFAKQGEDMKNAWTTAQSNTSMAGRAAAMTVYNGKASQMKADVATSKNLLLNHASRIANGMKMQQEDVPDGYNDRTDQLLTVPLRDPKVNDLINGSDLNATPHFDMDKENLYARKAYTHESSTVNEPGRQGNLRGYNSSTTQSFDTEKAARHLEDQYNQSSSARNQINNLEKNVTDDELADYQKKYGADNVKNKHDAAIYHNVAGNDFDAITKTTFHQGKMPVNIAVKNYPDPLAPKSGQSLNKVHLDGTYANPTGGADIASSSNVHDYIADSQAPVTMLANGAIDTETGEPVPAKVLTDAKSAGHGWKYMFKAGTKNNVKDAKTGKSNEVDVGGRQVQAGTEDRLLADPYWKDKIEKVNGNIVTSNETDDFGRAKKKTYFLPSENIESKDTKGKNSPIANGKQQAQNRASQNATRSKNDAAVNKASNPSPKVNSKPAPQTTPNTPKSTIKVAKPTEVAEAADVVALKNVFKKKK